MKDYLLLMCEESYRCNPDTIGFELVVVGVVLTIGLIGWLIQKVRK